MLKLNINFLKNFFHKYERRLGFAFLVGGFVFDSLTLKRVDLFWDNLVLLFYLFLVALGILAINLRAGKHDNIVSYAMQFAFGGLFSGYIIFYSKSASLSASLPFFLMLGIFFVGNEFFRERYKRFSFHLGVFFAAVFSYAIFSLPILLRRLGPEIFILSGFASLAIITLLVYLVKKTAPGKFYEHRKMTIFTISGIYLAFNILYFANIIPPIPLAMKEAGIYHRVERVFDGNYALYGEKREWYEFWRKNKFYFLPGESVYAYTAVFAPTKIKSRIFHRWSFFDEENDKWAESVKIGFPIVGGRDGGYRGYSIKESVRAGRWRVDVVTERGQVVGRLNFEIVETRTEPKLELEIR